MLVMLVFMLICHYLADFVLTTDKMIEAKSDGRQLGPIMMHASVHAVLMSCVVLLMLNGWECALAVFAIEAVTHFLIDTAKGRLTAHYPLLSDMHGKPYWMLFGFDQLLHLMVIVVICSVYPLFE